METILKPIKERTIGSSLEIHSNDDFPSHLVLITHIENELLPVFEDCRIYTFNIGFLSDEKAATNIVASILQFGQITRCSNIEFSFTDCQMDLPVDAISNWLQNSNVHKRKDGRLLEINIYGKSKNVGAVMYHLKKVKFFLII